MLQYPDDFNKVVFKQRFSKTALRKLADAMRVPNSTQALFLLDKPMTAKKLRQISAGLGVRIRVGNYPTGISINWDEFHAVLEQHGIKQSDLAKAVGMSRSAFNVVAKHSATRNANVTLLLAIAEAMRANIIIDNVEANNADA